MKLIILGQVASGKGTYASRISKLLGIPHISTGQLMRDEIETGSELGKRIKVFVDNQDWEGANDDILEMVKKRISEPDAQKGFIFDGFPRSLYQAEKLDGITDIDAVISLKVPEWIIIKRIDSRRTCENCSKIYNVLFLKSKVEGVCDECGGKLIQRSDETPQATKNRINENNRLTGPIIDFYKKKGLIKDIVNDEIDTPPEPIVNRILEALGLEERL